MATFTFYCPCPKRVAFHAEEQHIGRHLQCRELGCNRLVAIQRLQRAPQAIPSPEPPPSHPRRTAATNTPSPRPRPPRHGAWPVWWRDRRLLWGIMVVFVLPPACLALLSYLNRLHSPMITRSAISSPSTRTTLQGPAYPAAPTARHEAPAVPEQPVCQGPAFSLPTGKELTPPPVRQGWGELTVRNGRERDSVVRLVEGSEGTVVYRGVYIQAGQTVTLSHVARGRYTLQFALGQAWNEEVHDFLCPHAYFTFRTPLEFQERWDPTGVQYTTMEFTLHAVPGGNVVPSRLRPEEWRRGHWGVGGPATSPHVVPRRD